MLPKVWELMSNLFLLGPSGLTVGHTLAAKAWERAAPRVGLWEGCWTPTLSRLLGSSVQGMETSLG